ncbi:hypothetical protein D3C78_1328780 [compost metagenome]
MHVFQVVAGGDDAVCDTLFLHVHVEGIEMDKDVIGTDTFDQRHRLFGGIEQMVLVAVHGLDAELQAERFRVAGSPRKCPCQVVIFTLRRRKSGSLIGAAIGDPRQRLRPHFCSLVERGVQMVDSRVGTYGRPGGLRQHKRTDGA